MAPIGRLAFLGSSSEVVGFPLRPRSPSARIQPGHRITRRHVGPANRSSKETSSIRATTSNTCSPSAWRRSTDYRTDCGLLQRARREQVARISRSARGSECCAGCGCADRGIRATLELCGRSVAVGVYSDRLKEEVRLEYMRPE